MSKFEILKDDTIEENGVKLYRIKATKTFSTIHKGTLGGYIENDYNLSQEGNCWIYENSIVYGKSVVMDNALIFDSIIKSEIINGDKIMFENKILNKDTDLYTSFYYMHNIYANITGSINEFTKPPISIYNNPLYYNMR